MRIHQVKLEHVRNLKELTLDLSSPLTIIAGRNGIGKTALQEAILAAMFERDKKSRDSLVSHFDRHSPPTATLLLARDGGQATIKLSRVLTDKQGEWHENGTTIKAKGKALEMIQASLPISADAAALLLWGQQDDLAAIVADFPSDGHTLLTAATIKGSGPDPKQVVEELDKRSKEAKRGGRNPGPLTQAKQRVEQLENELDEAQQAQNAFEDRQREYHQARVERGRLKELCENSQEEVRHLDRLDKLLEPALQTSHEVSALEQRQVQWSGLDDQTARCRRRVADLRDELSRLVSQYRVARHAELADRIQRLNIQIRLVKDAETTRRGLEEQISARRWPDQRDLDWLRKMQEQGNEALNRIDATGLRYELSVGAGSKTVEVSEDNAATPQNVTLTPGKRHEGIAGSVSIRAEDLRLVASGKEDVASLKRSVERAEKEIAALLSRFGVDDRDAFQLLFHEGKRLNDALQQARVDVDKHLQNNTAESLKANLELLQNALAENNMTPQDQQACSATVLPKGADIKEKIARKETDLEHAEANLKKCESQRPTESEKEQLVSALAEARKNAEQARHQFISEDAEQRAPAQELKGEIRSNLEEKRKRLDQLKDQFGAANSKVTVLTEQLKHAGPKRPIPGIEADLHGAREIQRRETTLQDARQRLKQCVEEKIAEMSGNVPRQLGAQISKHLARLTDRAYAKVSLNEQLQVASVTEGGQQPVEWEPQKLSTGERALTALTVKIAVARALAEAGNPVFVMLDDSLVDLDPQHRAATEDLLLQLVADGMLQVILITCHSDWALDWKKRSGNKLQYIDFAKEAVYYRKPPALTRA